MYVPDKRMLALCSERMFAKSEDLKQNQTRLKLKFDNIQHSIFMFEECHLSQYHQSEGWAVERDVGRILPFEMYFEAVHADSMIQAGSKSLNGMLAYDLV